MKATPKNCLAQINIVGPDQKGIISAITTFLYQYSCNIEDIDQRILEGILSMNMLIDFSSCPGKDFQALETNLKKVAKGWGMKAKLNCLESKQKKNVAILVTKESHCLKTLIEAFQKKKINGEVSVIIGNHPDLESISVENKIPFFFVPSQNRKKHEKEVLKLLEKYDVDLIVLARYMQILSPEFVFHHEGRIINIHPSLLPAFPGPRSYHQAFNKGVEVVGVTAHFATTDLDEGPIICQDSFRVNKLKDSLEDIIEKGQKLEAKTLLRAVKLFLEDKLCLRRGKVIPDKHLRIMSKKTKGFYQNEGIS